MFSSDLTGKWTCFYWEITLRKPISISVSDAKLRLDFSDVQKGGALERISDFGCEKGLDIKPREKKEAISDWPTETVQGEEKPHRKKLSAEEVAERYKGRYAEVLDATIISGLENKEGYRRIDGIIYDDHHRPMATRDAICVYLPLIPHQYVYPDSSYNSLLISCFTYRCQPDYDPSTAAFSSSYNLVW